MKKAFQISVEKKNFTHKPSLRLWRRRRQERDTRKQGVGFFDELHVLAMVIMQNNRRRHDGKMIEMMILFSQCLIL